MRLAELSVEGLARGATVVSIPLRERVDPESVAATVEGLLEHAPTARLLLVGSAPALQRASDALAARVPEAQAQALEGTFVNDVDALRAALCASAPADVALVAPGVLVGPGWLEGLERAGRVDTTVASVSPLSLGGAGIELAEDDIGGDEHSPESVARARRAIVSRRALARPRISAVGPACCLLRRSAVELVGLPENSPSLRWSLGDWAARTMAAGMVHVLADDVLVTSLAQEAPEPPLASELPSGAARADEWESALLVERGGVLGGALATATARVRRGGLSVTLDARALVETVGGTQTYLLGLVKALGERDDLSLRVLTPPDLSRQAAELLSDAPGVDVVGYEQAVAEPRATDVIHRPQQVFNRPDYELLRLLGERIVIGHQDLIAYRNPSYHADVEGWQAYRRATRLTLGGVDQVVFFSEHARRDALLEGLLGDERAHVVGIGRELSDREAARPPERLPATEPFLLCVSADYAHKNRPFAIELLQALQGLGWPGGLVLAGGHVAYGSSRERERELLAADPGLAASVLDLGPVQEPVKRWLFEHARALVYPTVYEGYGLLPLEAAAAGVPCLFAAGTSLEEVAPGAATLTPWDARASAAAVLELLADGTARERHLARLHEVSAPSWAEVAEQLVTVYERALAAPLLVDGPRDWEDVDREAHLAEREREIERLTGVAQEYQDAYHSLQARVRHGLPLIDEGGLLSEAQQRGLMRVAARGRLGAVALSPLALFGRRPGSEVGGRRR